MSRRDSVRTICLVAILAVVAWLLLARKVAPPRALKESAHRVAPVKANREATQAIESAPAQPKDTPIRETQPSHAGPTMANQLERYSDLELQSRPMQQVQLMPPRVAADVPLLPGFVGAATWRNLGTSTASAAFETHCWAIDHGDADMLLATVDMSDAARAKLKIIFDRLPPEAREKYGSPERMMGMIWVYHGLPFSGFMIESEVARSPVETGVLLQLQYGQSGASREFLFKQAADGWRKVTPDQQVDNFLRMSGISPDAPR